LRGHSDALVAYRDLKKEPFGGILAAAKQYIGTFAQIEVSINSDDALLGEFDCIRKEIKKNLLQSTPVER